MKVDFFSNGEARPVIKPSVHGKKIFLISTVSSSCRAAEHIVCEKSINDHLIGVMLTIGALRRAGAKEVTLILPSYPYARQDKKDEPHAAISASHVAKLLAVSGISRLICMDLHAAAIQGFFPEEIPVDNLYAIAPIIEYIRNTVFSNPKYLKDSVTDTLEVKLRDSQDCFIAVSPDEGAFKRTRKYAESLRMPYLCLTKTRDYARKNFIDESKTLIFGNTDELKNRWSIIFDDMCDTFGTIQAAAKKLVEAGSLGVIVVVTHGILSGPAIQRLNQTSEVVELICSDSLPQVKNKQLSYKISTFSIAPLLAEVIRRRLCKESVSEIFYHT
jgi:ribose-phosphate pyrophosphokinase